MSDQTENPEIVAASAHVSPAAPTWTQACLSREARRAWRRRRRTRGVRFALHLGA